MKRQCISLFTIAVLWTSTADARTKQACREQDDRIAALEAENAALRLKLQSVTTPAPTDAPTDAPTSSEAPSAPETAASDEGFGGIAWGTTAADFARRMPKAKRGDDGRTWFVEQRLAAHDAIVGYVFVNDQFVIAVVMFTEKYMNTNKYLDVHDDVRALLSHKYGEPTLASRDYWSDDLYRDDPNNWGMAVSTGRLTRISAWETPTTDIELVTKGDNFKVTNRIRYASKKHERLIDEDSQRRKTDGL
jgi:hypothetical protein